MCIRDSSPYFFFSVLYFFNLRSYFSLLVLEISVALFGLFLLFPGSSHIHPRGILMDKFFLERCLRLLKLHPQLVSALFGLFNIIQQDICLLYTSLHVLHKQIVFLLTEIKL